MKRLHNIYLLIALALITSCGEPPIVFIEPQPIGSKDLFTFPNRIQGQYVSKIDSSLLVIEDVLIKRVYDFYYKVHPNQLDSQLVFVDDKIINEQTLEKISFIKEGDSLLIHEHGTDTLFFVSQQNVLRKSKGYYFLNFYIDEDKWSVRKMEIIKGQLKISRISRQYELDNLMEITASPEDTIPPETFNISKKEFNEFVKRGGFTDEEIFLKLK